MERVSSLIIQKLENMVEAGDRDLILSKRKTVCALLPYAILLEQCGQQEMVDVISRAARTSGTIWFMRHIRSYITMLLDKPTSPSLDRVIVLVSPHIFWGDILHSRRAVIRWTVAVSEVPETEEIGESVVDSLLQLSDNSSLRAHIPAETWAWMKKVPSLPPVCHGRTVGSWPEIVRHVRGLGDVEILKSYFLLVWSEWDYLYYPGLEEMEISVQEDFAGIEMWGHREDLNRRLDYVRGQLDRGLEYLKQHDPRIDQYHIRTALERYGRVKEVLMEVDREAMRALTRASFKLTCSMNILILVMHTESHSTFCCALPLPFL